MGDEQANRQVLLIAHARAANYYQEQAKTTCAQRENRRKVNDVHDLIEAMWHYCMAEQWQDAYELMQAEYLFEDVNRWGGNTILLELYQLIPLGKSHLKRSQEATLSNNLGEVYYALGKYREALSYYEQALGAYQQTGDRKGEGEALDSIGAAYYALGPAKKALRYFEQALVIARDVGNRYDEGEYLWDIGTLCYTVKRNDIALACFLLARNIFEEVESPSRDEVQRRIDDLRNKIGEKQYRVLLSQVEPRSREIVDQMMRDGT